MTDDIVTRLENWDDQQPPFSVMQEAADELKRLRAAQEISTESETILPKESLLYSVKTNVS